MRACLLRRLAVRGAVGTAGLAKRPDLRDPGWVAPDLSDLTADLELFGDLTAEEFAAKQEELGRGCGWG